MKTQTNPQEEWINIMYAGLAYRDNGPQLAASLRMRVEQIDYTRLDYPGETLGYVNGAIVWTAVPQRLLWTFRDRLEQLPRNITDPLAPGNREAVNVAETGPDLLIPVTPVSTVVFDARAGNVWFKESTADYDYLSVAVRWRQRLDSVTTFSLNTEGSWTTYNEPATLPPGVEDYTRTSHYIRYDRRHPTLRLVADLGTTKAAFNTSNSEARRILAKLDFISRVSTESSMGVSASRDLMSLGSSLLAGVTDPGVVAPITTFTAVQADQAGGEIYFGRRIEAFYKLVQRDFNAQANIYYRDIDYLAVPQDRNEVGSVLRMTYRLDATRILGVWGANQKTEYASTLRLDRDVSYGAFLTYRIMPNLSFGFDASYIDRISSVATADYNETRGMLRLIYNTNPRATLDDAANAQLSSAAVR